LHKFPLKVTLAVEKNEEKKVKKTKARVEWKWGLCDNTHIPITPLMIGRESGGAAASAPSDIKTRKVNA